MATIKQTLGVFALAWMAGTASARTVEVVLDVGVTSRWIADNLRDEDESVLDTSFQPMTFTMSLFFDLDRIDEQKSGPLAPGGYYARTAYDGEAVSATSTPLTALLYKPAPETAGLRPLEHNLSHGKSLSGPPATSSGLLWSNEGLRLEKHSGWMGGGIDAPGATTIFSHRQEISLKMSWGQAPFQELSKLSGDDALALLQSVNNGIPLYGDFSEGSGYTVMNQMDDRVIHSLGILYRGSVVVRSATVVPEPGTWMMSALGLALIAWRSRAVRNRGMRAA